MWQLGGKEVTMEFQKADASTDYMPRVIHCTYCDCDDDDGYSNNNTLNKQTAKATGG